jgi:hypothetical protein
MKQYHGVTTDKVLDPHQHLLGILNILITFADELDHVPWPQILEVIYEHLVLSATAGQFEINRQVGQGPEGLIQYPIHILGSVGFDNYRFQSSCALPIKEGVDQCEHLILRLLKRFPSRNANVAGVGVDLGDPFKDDRYSNIVTFCQPAILCITMLTPQGAPSKSNERSHCPTVKTLALNGSEYFFNFHELPLIPILSQPFL